MNQQNKLSDEVFYNESSEDDSFENVIPPQDIFAFNETRSCADLKRMYDKKQIDIKPPFQRERVWKPADKTRFIDSLLKNLPIPSMCVSLDIKTNKRCVIDGLQRISTIVEFLEAAEDSNNKDYILSDIDDVDSRLAGKSVKQIQQEYPEVISDIENVSIPVTTLRCNLDKENHMEYIFTIFYRLNTGGTKLNPQEIRNCIFSGGFNNMLLNCSNHNNSTIKEYLGENKRFSHEEFILRFFAFQDSDLDKNYTGRLTSFLNKYMDQNRKLDELSILCKKKLFNRVISFIQAKSLEKISKIVFESILYGVAKNIDYLESDVTDIEFNHKVKELMMTQAFKTEELQSGLFQRAKVLARLNKANEVFGR
jgi:hypothetical protein